MEELSYSIDLNIPPPNSPSIPNFSYENKFLTDPITDFDVNDDGDDDGFEAYSEYLKRQIEQAKNQLRGGCPLIRKPKQPLKVFLRFHVEQFDVMKKQNPKWTPVQIALNLKNQWSKMTNQQKETYYTCYNREFKKYERLIKQFTQLTFKPKRPQTPYFLFFSELLPSYRKKHPKLDQKELAKLIGQEWTKCDAQKRNEFERESNRLKEIYAKHIETYKRHMSNDSKRFGDYLKKLEEYEIELNDELYSLRFKHLIKPSRSSKLSPVGTGTGNEGARNDVGTSATDSIISEGKQNHFTRSNKLGKNKRDEEEKREEVKEEPEEEKSQQFKSKGSSPPAKNSADERQKLSTSKIDVKSNTSNKGTPKRIPKKSEQVRKKSIDKQIDKREKVGMQTTHRSPIQLRSSPRNEIPTDSQKNRKTKSKVNTPKQPVNEKEVKQPKKETPQKKVSIKKASEKIQLKSKPISQARVKAVSVVKKVKQVISKDKNGSKIISKGENANSKNNSKKDNQSAELIKYILGMRKGLETEYLVLFEDKSQYWTNDQDPIFEIRQNSIKLNIFQGQIESNFD